MTHTKLKLSIMTVILLAAVSYLAVAGVKKGWVYYVDVDQLQTQSQYQTQRVRLAGRVHDELVDVQRGAFRADFTLLGKDNTVKVAYQGVVPEQFEPGCEVVLEGTLDDKGVFQADLLMTKCASKYQAEEHAQRLEPAS